VDLDGAEVPGGAELPLWISAARSSPPVAMAGRGFGRGGGKAAAAWWVGAVQVADGGGEQRQRPEADRIWGRAGPSCEIHAAASPADEPDLEVNTPPPQLPGAT
jgi:hypothetical protein